MFIEANGGPGIITYYARPLTMGSNWPTSAKKSYIRRMTTPQFSNSFQKLSPWLYEWVNPTPLKNAKLIHSTKLKETLGLGDLSDIQLTDWLNGERGLPGEQRISTRYAGHQFGVWAGQLGDGRAISLGEIITSEGRLEIQTKGSGLTPFSRMGDGKAVVRSSVREYLCSEAMQGLRIPTTRVLALITGEDEVYRESIEASALVARIFPSNLRFGHFEMCFHSEHLEELRELIEYTRITFFGGKELEVMLDEIVSSTAKLMARWMGVGFCHGVMNTDNMSVLGLTIDYGPFGFMEDTDLGYICNHSDHQGRYSYHQQPSIAMWNLERFLVCFLKTLPQEKLEAILSKYPAYFEEAFLAEGRKKLGLLNAEADDHQLFASLLRVMSDLSLDFTFVFRGLSRYSGVDSLKEIWEYYGNRQELKDWLAKYDQRLLRESRSQSERHEAMLQVNPKYVLKNYIAHEVIGDVEKGSSQKLKAWLQVLASPFEEHPEFESYARPTPPEHKNHVVSCSS